MSDARSRRRLRVVVVDADRRVRDSLAELLALGEELEVVGRAAHADGALAICTDTEPDVVVIDPRLPDADAGRDLIRQLRGRFPAAALLVLSWPASSEADREIDALVDGLVPKSDPPSELVRRIVELAARPDRSPTRSADRGSPRC